MSLLKWMVSVVVLLVMAACGGGGGSAGKPPFPDPGTDPTGPTPASLVVTLSPTTIPNTGTGSITATVTALDANRNAVEGVAITLVAQSPVIAALLDAGTGTTDAAGQVAYKLTVPAGSTNGPVTVTAKASGVSDATATLQIVDSASGAVPSSVEVVATSTLVGTGGETVTLTAFVKDSNNNALPAAPVAFTATEGTLSSVSTATDTGGAATAVFGAGANRTNRKSLVKVTSGTATGSIELTITGNKMQVSGATALIVGGTAAYDIVLTDSKGRAIPSTSVTAVSSLGNPLAVSPKATDPNGTATFIYTATNSGNDVLTFSGAGVSQTISLAVSSEDFGFVSPAASTKVSVNTGQTITVRLRNNGVGVDGQVIKFAATGGSLSAASVTTAGGGLASTVLTSQSAGPVTVQATATTSGKQLSATLPLVIVADDPQKLVLQASPTAIAPTSGVAQIVAKVTDGAGNPVQGVTVNFTRVEDPSGGNLSQASSTTLENGQATVNFNAGGQSTADQGVLLKAEVASKPSVSGTARLTVNRSSLFIALGTGNVIGQLDSQTYKKDWVAYVTDANGIPVEGATLTVKVIPVAYLTGTLTYQDPVWAYASPAWSCRNEDADLDGILGPTEDDNRDGVLWPGNVIAVQPGSVQTSGGVATISLIYAESYAPWVQVKLVVTATVAGTESSTTQEFVVVGAAEDFTDKTVPPAGRNSPFGAQPNVRVPGACVQFQ